MENASKALIIVAGVLIGIMILSLAVYLTTTMGGSAAKVHEQVRQDQLSQFNSQFTKYDGREDATIYDILTIANLAMNNNEEYDLLPAGNRENENSFYITVKLKNDYIETKDKIDEYMNNIGNKLGNESPNGNLKKYKCRSFISSTTGRVYKVEFSEKSA